MSEQFRVGQSFYPSQTRFPAKQMAPAQTKKPFEQWLQDSLPGASQKQAQPLRFSQHASVRMRERGIELDAAHLAKLEGAVTKAAGKGAKESLIMMDNVAFVVSIVNRKVITAVEQGQLKDNVFTNIDSAIFV
ncbi:TIGR02530 family flagellar biosynthesis protein [Brevibacillus fluminis]|uniref:TIGR02530 family flagellar biosynthesis protein n=1 Tax=Brevibacillus fluminis TaxID=511487 RepID=UPI003F88FD39